MNRRDLADEVDRIDKELDALQNDKRELFAAYREAHGKAECKAAQVAIKRRQKYRAGKASEMEEHDALVDEIFVEISAPLARSAPRVAEAA